MIRTAMVTLLLAVPTVTGFVTLGLAPPADNPVAVEIAEPNPELELASFTLPGFSEAYFTGTWCYITCADGSGDTVRSFSTGGCCSACANFCGTSCVANGGGPSVLCDDGF